MHPGSSYSSSDGINRIGVIGGKANTICDKPTESKASKETIYPEIIQKIYGMKCSPQI